MHWYFAVLGKYAEFKGRARRKEYWMFTLFNIVISLAIGFTEGFVGGSGMIGLIYTLGVLLPSLGVVIRRLHDTGRSGWWFLISLLPIIGLIVLLVFLVLDSEEGENAYGPNPKDVAA